MMVEEKEARLVKLLIILFLFILAVTTLFNILNRDWKDVFFVLLPLVCIPIPFIIVHFAKVKNVALPPYFTLAIIIFIFGTEYLGEIEDFYVKFSWWDLLLHGIFGVYTVITAFYLFDSIGVRKERTNLTRYYLFAAVFAFCFSVTLETLWEIFEFTGDYVLKTRMLKGGLDDTMTDIIIETVMALAASIFFNRRLIKQGNYIEDLIEKQSK